MAAMAVNGAADERRHETAEEQAEREAAHGERDRPAAIGGDQRHGQHRRIEDRAPGEDLRDAEHRHRAPRADEEVTHTRHRNSQWRSCANYAVTAVAA